MLINILQSDLLFTILDNFSLFDMYHLQKVIKCNKINRYFNKKINQLSIPTPLKSILYQHPFLTFNPRFLGHTGYIDGIKFTDLSAPIMVGYDNHNRWFITIKYKCIENWQFDGEIIQKCDKIHCLTIFRRYIDGKSWYQCGDGCKQYNAPLLYTSSICLSDEDILLFRNNINRLLDKQPIIYMDYINKSANYPTVKKQVMCQLID